MNELKLFEFENKPIRTINKGGEARFCLKDVCGILDLKQVTRAKDRLKKDGVTASKIIDKLNRQQQAIFINESNLYKTIFQSRRKEAEEFADYVTGTILPSIRKTGGYMVRQNEMNDTELLANAVLISERIREEQTKKIELLENENVEMTTLAELFAGSRDFYTVTEISKHYGMNARVFNQLLYKLKIQRSVSKRWVPTAKYKDSNYMAEGAKNNYKNGVVDNVVKFNAWTKEGVAFLYKHLKKQWCYTKW